jgi:hypothetical protein
MAQIDVEGIINDLDREFKKALSKSVSEVIPDAEFNESELFRRFKREINRKCHSWETVSDQYVR